MNSVFFVFEIIGVIAFALSGALVAIKNQMDIFGASVLGMTTAVGGGVIRDLLLGISPPNALINPLHALIAIGVSALTYLPLSNKFFKCGKKKAFDLLLMLADSIGLGIFTVVGVNMGMEHVLSPNLFTIVCLGVVTGVGGGVLRDVMAHSIPKIFVKHFYACASIIGAFVYALIYTIFNTLFASIIGITIVIALRLIATFFHWELPKPNNNE